MRVCSGIVDGEEFSKTATTRLEAAFIALDEAGQFGSSWIEESVLVGWLASMPVYSQETSHDRAALEANFQVDAQYRFKRGYTELGFERQPRRSSANGREGRPVRTYWYRKRRKTTLSREHALELAAHICASSERLERVTAALEQHCDQPHEHSHLVAFFWQELPGLFERLKELGILTRDDEASDDEASGRGEPASKRSKVHRCKGGAEYERRMAEHTDMLLRSDMGSETFSQVMAVLCTLLRTGALVAVKEAAEKGIGRRLWAGICQLMDVVCDVDVTLGESALQMPFMDETEQEERVEHRPEQEVEQRRLLSETLPRLSSMLSSDGGKNSAYISVGLPTPDGELEMHECVLGATPPEGGITEDERHFLDALGAVLGHFRVQGEARIVPGRDDTHVTQALLDREIEDSTCNSFINRLIRGLAIPLSDVGKPSRASEPSDDRLRRVGFAAEQVVKKMLNPNLVPPLQRHLGNLGASTNAKQSFTQSLTTYGFSASATSVLRQRGTSVEHGGLIINMPKLEMDEIAILQ